MDTPVSSITPSQNSCIYDFSIYFDCFFWRHETDSIREIALGGEIDDVFDIDIVVVSKVAVLFQHFRDLPEFVAIHRPVLDSVFEPIQVSRTQRPTLPEVCETLCGLGVHVVEPLEHGDDIFTTVREEAFSFVPVSYSPTG
jgi:hypothetical protein